MEEPEKMPLNGIVLLAVALGLAGLVVFVVRAERIPGWPAAISRKDSPALYWIVVGVWTIIAAGFLFGSIASLTGGMALSLN